MACFIERCLHSGRLKVLSVLATADFTPPLPAERVGGEHRKGVGSVEGGAIERWNLRGVRPVSQRPAGGAILRSALLACLEP